METNEQKLTKEEKLMFFILGLILTVAVGVLIIDGFSKNDKSLKSETPTSEVETGDEEQTQESSSNLIEVPQEESESKENSSEEQQEIENNTESEKEKSEVQENTDKQEENNSKENNTSEQEKNNGKKNLPYTAADDEDYVDNHESGWKVSREVVTEAYTGTKIKINKNVVLENGVMEEAVVTVRKVIGNRLVIVDTTDSEFIAEEGTYIYSYTHNNITKEVTLKVYNNLELEDVDILGLKETEDNKSGLSKESFNYIYQNNLNSTISLEDDVYTLTSVKNKKSNEVIIKVRLTNHANSITSKTRGVKVLEHGKYHDELYDNEIILLLNLDILSKEDTNIITLNIDGKNYVFKMNIKLVNTRKELKDKKGNATKDTKENKILVEEPPTVPEELEQQDKPHVEYLLNVTERIDVNNNSLEEFPWKTQ